MEKELERLEKEAGNLKAQKLALEAQKPKNAEPPTRQRGVAALLVLV